MKTLFLGVCLFFIGQLASGETTGDVTLMGKVKSFDEKFVVLVSNDTTFKIPRSLVTQLHLRSSQDLEVPLQQADIEHYIVKK